MQLYRHWKTIDRKPFFPIEPFGNTLYQNQEVYVTTEDARRLEQATNELLAFNPDWRYICLEDLLALFAQPFTDFGLRQLLKMKNVKLT